tara:strand:- start:1815 stop:2165 length:351 start_codon:yes stop_codon:yes gene_type:complete
MPKVSRSRRRNSRSKRSRSNRRSKSRRVSSRNTLRRKSRKSRRSLKGGSGAGAPQNRDLARQRAERARRYAEEDAAKQASAEPELTGDQQWCMGNLPLCEKIKGSVYEELKKLDKI